MSRDFHNEIGRLFEICWDLTVKCTAQGEIERPANGEGKKGGTVKEAENQCSSGKDLNSNGRVEIGCFPPVWNTDIVL